MVRFHGQAVHCASPLQCFSAFGRIMQAIDRNDDGQISKYLDRPLTDHALHTVSHHKSKAWCGVNRYCDVSCVRVHVSGSSANFLSYLSDNKVQLSASGTVLVQLKRLKTHIVAEQMVDQVRKEQELKNIQQNLMAQRIIT